MSQAAVDVSTDVRSFVDNLGWTDHSKQKEPTCSFPASVPSRSSRHLAELQPFSPPFRHKSLCSQKFYEVSELQLQSV